MPDLLDRISGKFDIDDNGCWGWTGYGTPEGYGIISMVEGGRQTPRMAHRIAYEALVGQIPNELECDHLCRNRCCINPDHIELVSKTENVMRGIGVGPTNKAKTLCLRGHPLSGDNVYAPPLEPQKRKCKECSRLRAAAYRERQ